MQKKLFATVVTALALTAIGIGPASASAATLTLKEFGQPSEGLILSGGPNIYMGLGAKECDEISLVAEVTSNAADPVTLSVGEGGGELTNCWMWARNEGVQYSNIETFAPITLKPNGTGTLPIRLDETRPVNGTCTRKGTLSVTWSPANKVSYSGLTYSSEPGHCPYEDSMSGNLTAMGFGGVPIEWVVAP